MTMNESFFGQYSVFCVFGSVVGCVVVPLIAQVLQQQSMECVILSAIVISLTAAHLNKKGGNDSPNSRMFIAKELEKKRVHHNNNNNKKHKNHTIHSQQHIHHQHTTSSQQHQHEQEYMQQHEHLKERRSEEKRLKKLRKREERLKKRGEENRKQQELEERYRTLKEKRVKQKVNFFKINNSTLDSSVACFEKYCINDCADKKQRHGLSSVDENRPSKKQTFPNHQKIPRFERSRTASLENASSFRHCSKRGVANNLTIKCSSSLSASCSSLSSISSSGSSSPPLPSSPPPVNNTVWKTPVHGNHDLFTTQTHVASQSSWASSSNMVSPSKQNTERVSKSYSNVRQCRSKPTTYGINNTSLFCTHHDPVQKQPVKETTEARGEEPSFCGEYSLFGPQQFGNTFKSPIM